MAELNFHHLRYFQTVAHEGNLTRAAERLHVSQSAVSTQIRQLEERLGQQLSLQAGSVVEPLALELQDALEPAFGIGSLRLVAVALRREFQRRGGGWRAA